MKGTIDLINSIFARIEKNNNVYNMKRLRTIACLLIVLMHFSAIYDFWSLIKLPAAQPFSGSVQDGITTTTCLFIVLFLGFLFY